MIKKFPVGSGRPAHSNATPAHGGEKPTTTPPRPSQDDRHAIDEHFASLESPLGGFPGLALEESLDDLKRLAFETFCSRYRIFRGEPILTSHLDWLVCYFLLNDNFTHIPELEACKTPGSPFWLTAEGRARIREGLKHIYQMTLAYAGDACRISPNLGSHLNYMEGQAERLVGVLLKVLPQPEAKQTPPLATEN